MMLKEQLVGFINSLTDILYCLRTYQLPKRVTLSELGNVFLKSRTVQVLPPHPVVPFVKGNTFVIDNSSGINRPLKIPIALVTVKFELQGFHATILSCIGSQWVANESRKIERENNHHQDRKTQTNSQSQRKDNDSAY
jgi:hypothetical protein